MGVDDLTFEFSKLITEKVRISQECASDADVNLKRSE